MKPRYFLVCISLLLLVSSVFATPSYPQHIVKYVTDEAHVLTPSQINALNDHCASIEQQTGVEIAIVTVTSTGGEDVIMYAAKTGELNGVGKKDLSDGVVILLSLEDRPGYAIETGRGAEYTLPDATVSKFAREAEPYLNTGDYYSGFENTLANIQITYKPENRTIIPTQQSGISIPFICGVLAIAVMSVRTKGGKS